MWRNTKENRKIKMIVSNCNIKNSECKVYRYKIKMCCYLYLFNNNKKMIHYFFFNDTATTEIYTLSLPRRSSDLAVLLHVGHEAVGPGNETGRLHMFVSHFFPLLLLFPLFLPDFLSKKVTQNSNWLYSSHIFLIWHRIFLNIL